MFTSFVWGTRHAGMNGQRVTNAVTYIHQNLGMSPSCSHKSNGCDPTCLHNNSDIYTPFNSLNYSDDIAGCEPTFERATLAFSVMGSLLQELGLSESIEKAVAPCTILNYLGLEFDTSTLEMRISPAKCDELKSELMKWLNKTVASKSQLQSILGKLLWVSKAVKFS